jgi:hypothetical protein
MIESTTTTVTSFAPIDTSITSIALRIFLIVSFTIVVNDTAVVFVVVTLIEGFNLKLQQRNL